VNVLLLEDDAQLQKMTARLLKRAFENVAVAITTVDSVPKAIAMLQHFTYDLVISDFNVLHGTGGDVLAWLHVEKPHVASRFIFFSGADEPKKLHDKVIEKGCTSDEFIDQLRKLAEISP
jgi:response regulator of citrate/malate metabolism